MKAVAMSRAVNQAVADFSSDVALFLWQLHRGNVEGDPCSIAAQHQRRLREFVRCTGVDLNELPAWQDNTTKWRAIARLASPALRTTTQAG